MEKSVRDDAESDACIVSRNNTEGIGQEFLFGGPCLQLIEPIAPIVPSEVQSGAEVFGNDDEVDPRRVCPQTWNMPNLPLKDQF